jgi:hypothetical protein
MLATSAIARLTMIHLRRHPDDVAGKLDDGDGILAESA